MEPVKPEAVARGGAAERAAQPPPRRRDATATREALLNAAAPLFAEHGFEATTVSRIAKAAGFSPNLITRYFGGKEGLFLAVTQPGLNLEAAIQGEAHDFGARLATQIVDRWQREGQGDPLLALIRSAASRPETSKALGEFYEREAVAPVVRWLVAQGLHELDAVGRANAIQSFVLGTVIARKVLRTGDVAAASSADLHRWLADALQRLLGEIPDPATPPSRRSTPPARRP